MNKLVPCAWPLSGALDVWSLRLRLGREMANGEKIDLIFYGDLVQYKLELDEAGRFGDSIWAPAVSATGKLSNYQSSFYFYQRITLINPITI